MISIIVPIYNLESCLPQCINSILGQDYRDFELLLIDDGSKDKSGDICDEYAAKDSRIRVFHKENGGVSSARNVGLENAKGDWITFVDGDDILLPKALSYIHEAIRQESAQLYLFDYLSNSQPVNQKLNKVLSTDDFVKMLLLYRIESSPWAKVYKAEALNCLRFNMSLAIGEDWLFNFEFAMSNSVDNRIIHINRCIYNYINREGSAMFSNTLKKKYEKLNEIAIPIIEKLLMGKMDQEVQSFKAVNVFQPNWKMGIVPSQKDDEVLITIQSNEELLSEMLITYIKLLNKNSRIAHVYFNYRKWRSRIHNMFK